MALIEQPFSSMDVLARLLGSLPKPKDDWRLVKDPVSGSINALPQLAGFAVATNGIMVLLFERVSNRFNYGHLAFFVKDDVWDDSDLDEEISKVKNKAKTKVPKCFEGL